MPEQPLDFYKGVIRKMMNAANHPRTKPNEAAYYAAKAKEIATKYGLPMPRGRMDALEETLTVEQAWKVKLTFGKYNGRDFAWLLANVPTYWDWLSMQWEDGERMKWDERSVRWLIPLMERTAIKVLRSTVVKSNVSSGPLVDPAVRTQSGGAGSSWSCGQTVSKMWNCANISREPGKNLDVKG